MMVQQHQNQILPQGTLYVYVGKRRGWGGATLVKTRDESCSMKVLVTMVRLSIAPAFRVSKFSSFKYDGQFDFVNRPVRQE